MEARGLGLALASGDGRVGRRCGDGGGGGGWRECRGAESGEDFEFDIEAGGGGGRASGGVQCGGGDGNLEGGLLADVAKGGAGAGDIDVGGGGAHLGMQAPAVGAGDELRGLGGGPGDGLERGAQVREGVEIGSELDDQSEACLGVRRGRAGVGGGGGGECERVGGGVEG